MLPSEVIDQVLGTLKQSWQARPSRLAKDEVSRLLCICIAWPKVVHSVLASTPSNSTDYALVSLAPFCEKNLTAQPDVLCCALGLSLMKWRHEGHLSWHPEVISVQQTRSASS